MGNYGSVELNPKIKRSLNMPIARSAVFQE